MSVKSAVIRTEHTGDDEWVVKGVNHRVVVIGDQDLRLLIRFVKRGAVQQDVPAGLPDCVDLQRCREDGERSRA